MLADQQPSRIIIYAADVMVIHSCSNSTASRKIQLVRDWLNKKNHQEILIKEYCEYWGVDYIETCKFLKLL